MHLFLPHQRLSKKKGKVGGWLLPFFLTSRCNSCSHDAQTRLTGALTLFFSRLSFLAVLLLTSDCQPQPPSMSSFVLQFTQNNKRLRDDVPPHPPLTLAHFFLQGQLLPEPLASAATFLMLLIVRQEFRSADRTS